MARRTFFSFNYEEDVWRASNVRNSGALGEDNIEFIDASLWEKAKSQSGAAIQRLIDDAIGRSSVTCVLIGASTASRPWVKYEINKSIELGKGLFGIHIYRIKDRNGNESTRGENPLPSTYKVYLWNKDEGAKNLGRWSEAAYQQAHPS
jgi:hypothetical protein